jgi:hypothetical protein
VDDLYLLYHRLSGTGESPGVKGFENRISN